MPRRVFDLDTPDRFVADAVGRPGQRTFYLQARKGPMIVTVGIEKVQVAVLAERMDALLDELRARGLAVPEEPLPGSDDRRPLEEPLDEDFRVGTLTLSWDGRIEEFIIEARQATGIEEEAEEEEDAADEVAEDDPAGPDLLRVRLTPTAALTFIRRALDVVAAGRPPCPLCGEPLDPQGHFCVRRNGGYQH